MIKKIKLKIKKIKEPLKASTLFYNYKEFRISRDRTRIGFNSKALLY